MKDIFSGDIIGGENIFYGISKNVFFMFENNVYSPVLMVLEQLFRTKRVRSGGTPHGHGYFMSRLPGLLLKEWCNIFDCFTG